jgi:hypothetical protein
MVPGVHWALEPAPDFSNLDGFLAFLTIFESFLTRMIAPLNI